MSTSLPSLPSLPPLGNAANVDAFYTDDPSNPASAFYVPPAGTYQNNAGQTVPNSTPSQTSSTPTSTTPETTTTPASTTPSTTVSDTASAAWNKALSLFGLDIDLEDVVFVIVGLLLIAAGLFAFKTTQTIIQTGTKIAKPIAEVAAA